MTHWRLRWCQSSVHPWHPLLEITLVVKNMRQKRTYIFKRKIQAIEVLHLFRCFTHTPRCREASLCNICTKCRFALIRSLKLDVSVKSKCRERNASELAGTLSTGLASQGGANHRSPTSLPLLSSGHVGKESAVLLPNGWQGEPNLPLRTPGSDWHSSHLGDSQASQGSLHWLPYR